MPGPLLFGVIFDNSCWLLQETCEGPGSCWIYNVDELAFREYTIDIIINMLMDHINGGELSYMRAWSSRLLAISVA